MADTTLPGVLLKGTAAARPAANTVAKGTVYSATDTGAITQSDGSSWSTWATISSGLADPMTTRGDIIIRNSSNTTARLGIGSSGKVLSSDGTDISWQTPASASGILAVVNYNPVSDGTYAITGTTLADLDATNAKVTFTAPASGNVLVRVGVLCGSTASGGDPSCVLGLRESSTQVGDLVMIMNATAGIAHREVGFYVTGIAAGSHTYKLAGMLASSGGTGTIYYGQTERGGVVIAVESCP